MKLDDKWLHLRITLINPIDEKGVFNPKDAEPIDTISLGLHDLGFTFFKVLMECITLLLSRNGILPED